MTEINPGDIISHYRIAEKIGEGGMGIIYRAEDTALNRQVVLKFLHPELIRDEEANSRFFNEAQLVSGLDHANVCKIFEVEKAPDGRMFMAMAYYQGKSLDEMIREGRRKSESAFTLEKIIDIAVQTARGLSFAHEQGIVHRDIKPANIMLDQYGEVKILDFGLAKLKGQTQITREGLSLGTVSYMSPEQAGGETVDQRTDIWSLGVVLYELLTGSLPFTAEAEMGVIYSILHKSPPALGFTHAGIPTGLKRIIRRAMEKDPGKRYQQMREMLADLETLRHEEQTVQIDKWKYTPAEKKSPLRVMLLASAAVILIVAVLWGILHVSGQSRSSGSVDPFIEIRAKNSMAILNFENHTDDPRFNKLGRTISHLLATSLMQSRYVYVLPPEKMTDIIRDIGQNPEQALSRNMMEKLARQGNVHKILSGRIFKAGEEYRITAQLTDIGSDEVQYTNAIQGKGEGSLFTMADELARRVKSNLGLSREELAQDIQNQVIKVTTSSQEALQYFIDGKELYFQHRFTDALPLFEKATQLDPDYALAYWYIGQCHNYLGSDSETPRFLQKALQLSNRLSLRDRYLIRGYAAMHYERDCQKAIESYKKLLDLYPDDELARIFLGSLYRNQEEWDLSIEQFQKILTINPQTEIAYQNLSFLNCAKGKLQNAVNIVQNRIISSTIPDVYRMLHSLLLIRLSHFSEARNEFEKVPSSKIFKQFEDLPGRIDQLNGKLESAEVFFKKMSLSNDPHTRISGHLSLARLHLQRLEYSKSIDEIQKALEVIREEKRINDEGIALNTLIYIHFRRNEISQALQIMNSYLQKKPDSNPQFNSDWAEFWRALLLIKDNRINEAQKSISMMKSLVGSCHNKLTGRRALFLEAIIHDKLNQLPAAIEKYREAIALLPEEGVFRSDHAFLYENLYRTLNKMGSQTEPILILERILQLTFGREGWEDIPTLSLLQLSRDFEIQGNSVKALQYSRRFLSQLRGDTLRNREAAEAKERIARLSSSMK